MGDSVRRLKARKLYERFTGATADIIFKMMVKSLPKEAALIGPLEAVTYWAVRDGELGLYEHTFEEMPFLVVDPDGDQLYIVGGNYKFTDRGIEG